MDIKVLLFVAVVLYILSALCMRNTHPYAGSRGEKFESKQERRRVGTVLWVVATLLVGVAILAQLLITKG
jgi:phage shock protein PspC (stress-responsive transcriptional regulator)